MWVEATVTRLFLGEIEGMIEGLRRVKPGNEEAGKEMNGLPGYLKENKSIFKSFSNDMPESLAKE